MEGPPDEVPDYPAPLECIRTYYHYIKPKPVYYTLHFSLNVEIYISISTYIYSPSIIMIIMKYKSTQPCYIVMGLCTMKSFTDSKST